MSCNSAIYTVNSSMEEVPAQATIPFGNVVRRFGKKVQLEGGSIVLYGSGYYDVEVPATLIATAAGDVTLQLYQDGALVPGAEATETAAAAGDYITPKISCLVRNCGECCNSVLNLVVDSGVTIANVPAVVEKV